MKRQKGITLVALVITIVIIIILASVTITATFGDNGIIKKAELARDLASNSTIKEAEDMNGLMDEYANIMAGGGEIPEPPEDTTPPVINEITISNITENSITVTVNATDDSGEIASYKYFLNEVEQTIISSNTYTFTGLTAGTEYTIKVEAYDKANNKGESTKTASTKKKDTIADIIGGDKVKDNTEKEDDLGNKVWIPGGFGVASDSGTKVEDGIVIEDAKGNQFVWIPVGTYHTTKGDKINNLRRRTFTSSNATEVTGDDGISSYYYGEGNSSSVAKNQIEIFKTSVANKKGFYIGRYEQGIGNVCKKNVEPFANITRDQSKSESEAMYKDNKYVVSELMSSYAWDTALNFICQNNENEYALTITTDTTFGNIGTDKIEFTGSYTADKYSNICDMLGNCYEWTTEYCSVSRGPYVMRGGACNGKFYYASSRVHTGTNGSLTCNSFRIQLYIK